MLEGRYIVEVVHVYKRVFYPMAFSEIPYVWGIGERPNGQNTRGWSAADPNYQVGWCRVVPNSQRISYCMLETYVYRVYEIDPLIYPGRFIGWYPCKPDNVVFQYRLWGIPSPTGPKVDVGFLPDEVSLLGNYPNPFNSSTVINFSIPDKSHVLLSVFDIMGRKVKTLLNKEIAAGEYSIHWDGTDSEGYAVSSGIYYSHLEVADQVRTAKMTMLK